MAFKLSISCVPCVIHCVLCGEKSHHGEHNELHKGHKERLISVQLPSSALPPLSAIADPSPLSPAHNHSKL